MDNPVENHNSEPNKLISLMRNRCVPPGGASNGCLANSMSDPFFFVETHVLGILLLLLRSLVMLSWCHFASALTILLGPQMLWNSPSSPPSLFQPKPQIVSQESGRLHICCSIIKPSKWVPALSTCPFIGEIVTLIKTSQPMPKAPNIVCHECALMVKTSRLVLCCYYNNFPMCLLTWSSGSIKSESIPC